MICMYVRLESYSNMCGGYCCLQKRNKKKPVGNSESEGILSDNCLSVWATVWWWRRAGGGGGRFETQGGGGGPEKLGRRGAQEADTLHLPFPCPERGVREGEWQWLNGNSIRKPRKYVYKKNQKPRRKKKKWRKVHTSCTLVVLKIKTVQCPGGWMASPQPLCHHFSKLSLLSLKMSSSSPRHASPWPTSL